MISASIISSAAGTMPAAMIPLTVAAASSIDVKSSSSVRTTGGSRVSRTAMRVAMPIVPSEPDEAAAQVEAGLVGLEAAERARPSRRRARRRRASTCVAVTPDARQCGPPALVATLPPIVHACCDDGSGA